MENTSYIALSRQTALWRQMEVVANNIANANTPAYKGEQMMFTPYTVKSKSENSVFGRNLSFVQDVGVLRDTSEGPMTHTGAPLDVAIHDDGYFVIDTPAGQRYSREGHFHLDETGMMVTSSGYPVLQKSGQPVIFAPNETQITIAGDGTISTENGVIGNLQVVNFDNQQELRKAGDGTYQTTATPNDIDRPQVVQGMLEESNVQPVIEMTHMMSILRNYEGVQKIIENENDRQIKAMTILSQSQQQA
jgi:flagellar basal-body rod protein FlgF